MYLWQRMRVKYKESIQRPVQEVHERNILLSSMTCVNEGTDRQQEKWGLVEWAVSCVRLGGGGGLSENQVRWQANHPLRPLGWQEDSLASGARPPECLMGYGGGGGRGIGHSSLPASQAGHTAKQPEPLTSTHLFVGRWTLQSPLDGTWSIPLTSWSWQSARAYSPVFPSSHFPPLLLPTKGVYLRGRPFRGPLTLPDPAQGHVWLARPLTGPLKHPPTHTLHAPVQLIYRGHASWMEVHYCGSFVRH